MDTKRQHTPTPDEDPQTRPAPHEEQPAGTDPETGTAPTREEPAELADEWGEESFPASDPPQNWAGPDTQPAARRVGAQDSQEHTSTGNTRRAELHPQDAAAETNGAAYDDATEGGDGELSESALPRRTHPSDIAEVAPNEAESMPDSHPGEVPS